MDRCNKIFKFIIIFSILIISINKTTASTILSNFKEGSDYITLSSPLPKLLSNKHEVIEFFSYQCSHCYDIEPQLQLWLQSNQLNQVGFLRIPVALGPHWELSAKAYFVAEYFGITEEINKQLFNKIHYCKNLDESTIVHLFAQYGIEQNNFYKIYNSFQIELKLKKTKDLINNYSVRGVPAFFVDGRYEIISNRPLEVINFLITK